MHQTFDAALGINLLHVNQEGADHNRAHFDGWGDRSPSCAKNSKSPSSKAT
jgi:hypothetical protein